MSLTPSPLKRSTRKHLYNEDSRSQSPSTSGLSNGGGDGDSSGSGKGKMRAVFCDVVVEDMNTMEGYQIPEEMNNLIMNLGHLLRPPTTSPAFPTTPSKMSSLNLLSKSQDRKPNPEKLRHTLVELRSTEASYVQRIATLNKLYAQPLRQFSQRSDEAIIPKHAAKHIFGNIEAILPANQALLRDLDASLNGEDSREHWASVLLRHLKHFTSLYPAYLSNYDNAKILESQMLDKHPSFSKFLERTKFSATDGRHNLSLDSLLVEPVQRIGRYKLFLENARKEVEWEDPAQEIILEAIDVCNMIGNMEESEETRRAAAMWGLGRAIVNLPATLINSHRYFVDCIDVLDVPLSSAQASAAGGSGYQHHTQDLLCTLFLLNDKIVIAKRENTERTGRTLVGLDNIGRLAQDMMTHSAPSTTGPKSPFKGRNKSMKFVGEFDLGTVIARESDTYGFSLFLERPPSGFSDRWNERPMRRFRIIKPETPGDKERFLGNIWKSVAHLKAQDKRSSALRLQQQGLSVFWNLYDKKSYLREPRKAKIALQLVTSPSSLELPFGPGSPHAVARALFEHGDGCEYSIRIRGSKGEPTTSHVSQSALVKHVIEAALHLGLYDTPPRIPGPPKTAAPDRSASTHSHSNSLSISTRRPRSVAEVVDFMRSPSTTTNNSSPRRTLSKASKASTDDSRGTGTSLFSRDGASTAQTSIFSHSPGEEKRFSLDRFNSQGSSSAPPTRTLSRQSGSRPGSSYGTADSLSRPSTSQSRKEKVWYANEEYSRSSQQLARAPSLTSRPLGKTEKDEEDEEENPYAADAMLDESVEVLAQARISKTLSDALAGKSMTSPRSLSRTSSTKSLSRQRSGTAPLSRSTSTQSMRIEEEEEDMEPKEEILPPRTPSRSAMSPDMLLSPRTLQRNGTLSRPMGPRLPSPASAFGGSPRAPAQRPFSPSPGPSSRPFSPAPPPRLPTLDLEEDDLFSPKSNKLPSELIGERPQAAPRISSSDSASSFGKKRAYEEEGDENSSVSSKRALRELFNKQGERNSPNSGSVTPSSVEEPKSIFMGATTANKASSPVKRSIQKFESVEPLKISKTPRQHIHRDAHTKDLHRTSSIPRSPHTRNIAAQTQAKTGSAAPSPLVKSSSSRIPVPDLVNEESKKVNNKQLEELSMQVDLVRRQSKEERMKHGEERTRLVAENQQLREMVQRHQAELARLSEKLERFEEEKEKEMDEYEARAVKMANDLIDEQANTMEAKITARDAEISRLKQTLRRHGLL